MSKKVVIVLFAIILALAATAATARAENLAWNAVTTYTDGTSIGSASVTYTAYWSTSSNMTNLHAIGSAGSSTSRTFNVDSAGMSRGSVVYFTVKATVNGTDSALASALSWNVPVKAPSAPSNLRMQ